MRVCCLPFRSDYLFKVSPEPINSLRPELLDFWVVLTQCWGVPIGNVWPADRGVCIAQLLLIGDSGVGKSCLLLRFAVSFPLEKPQLPLRLQFTAP